MKGGQLIDDFHRNTPDPALPPYPLVDGCHARGVGGGGIVQLLHLSSALNGFHAATFRRVNSIATGVPRTLSHLLDKAEVLASSPAPPANLAAATTQQASPHDGIDGDAGHARIDDVAVRQLVVVLLDVARCTLTSNGGVGGSGSGGGAGVGSGTTTTKARCRALSLDCLRLGLLLLLLPPPLHLSPDGEGRMGDVELAREALAVAAVGARDERWEVRVAAARAGGEALRTGGRAMLVRLSSKQVCTCLLR